MKSLRCRLEFDEDSIHPVHKRIAADNAIEREFFLHAHRAENGPDTLLFYFEGDSGAYADALDSTDRVLEHDIMHLSETAHYAYVREDSSALDTQLEAAFNGPGQLVVPPIEFRSDGSALVTVVGETEALQSTLEDVPGQVGVEITHIGDLEMTPATQSVDLTPRQREAVEIAFDIGYYDIPRSGTMAEIANRMDCTTGTVSEHLRKAERAAMQSLVDFA